MTKSKTPARKTAKKATKKLTKKVAKNAWTPRKVNFAGDLARGKKGQDKLLDRSNGVLAQLDGKSNDFLVVKSGKKLELKTENYNINPKLKYSRELRRTPNIFIERWSDEKRSKIGGPFQALKNGSEYYAHLYNNNKIVIFKTKELVDRLNKMDFTLKYAKNKKSIFNPAGVKSWVTVGYSIPLADLLDLAHYIPLKSDELKKAFATKKVSKK